MQYFSDTTLKTYIYTLYSAVISVMNRKKVAIFVYAESVEKYVYLWYNKVL